MSLIKTAKHQGHVDCFGCHLRYLLVLIIVFQCNTVFAVPEQILFIDGSSFQDQRSLIDLTNDRNNRAFCGAARPGLRQAAQVLGVPLCGDSSNSVRPDRRARESVDQLLLIDDRHLNQRLRVWVWNLTINYHGHAMITPAAVYERIGNNPAPVRRLIVGEQYYQFAQSSFSSAVANQGHCLPQQADNLEAEVHRIRVQYHNNYSDFRNDIFDREEISSRQVYGSDHGQLAGVRLDCYAYRMRGMHRYYREQHYRDGQPVEMDLIFFRRAHCDTSQRCVEAVLVADRNMVNDMPDEQVTPQPADEDEVITQVEEGLQDPDFSPPEEPRTGEARCGINWPWEGGSEARDRSPCAYLSRMRSYIRAIRHIVNAQGMPTSTFNQYMLNIETHCPRGTGTEEQQIDCVLRTVPHLPHTPIHSMEDGSCYYQPGHPRYNTVTRGCRRAIRYWIDLQQSEQRLLRNDLQVQQRLRERLNRQWCDEWTRLIELERAQCPEPWD